MDGDDPLSFFGLDTQHINPKYLNKLNFYRGFVIDCIQYIL